MYHALYLDSMTEYHLREKLACLYDILPTQILELYLQGPSGIHILVTDNVSILDFVLFIFVFFLYTVLPLADYTGLSYFTFIVSSVKLEVCYCFRLSFTLCQPTGFLKKLLNLELD